ncbi:polyprenyl synthetase family protein [Ornithinimicrobium humiphilum]|uniref:Geranylgeranyl diphosphate synthase type II n=1 Tax=Ornithinimicrobium humiphilum TaxID=125288 RepID=A0A543KPB5_9MICO|nr:polyprenyl synthetase family protein [Ornithinimicrobium humiphilum]TQM96910.1 geranylgeranyl diphosphate synthase type II [Ornithinimicrobium humiphilum]
MTATTDPTPRLAAYGETARRAAADYLARTDASPYLLEPAGDYLARSGKGLRPALCLATSEAFGGSSTAALPSAAAIELLHTAMLVHDDVEDESELRRGSPTLHLRYGRASAINAGDGLAVVALGALRDNQALFGSDLAGRVWSEFELMGRRTVEGQARELGWQRDNVVDLGPEDYLDLILQKTCWYTTLLPLRVGALVGSQGRADLSALTRFGFYLGAAFQIRDDVLNLVGSTEHYGKEVAGDLREGKRTLMLLHLLAAAAPAERDRVVGLLALPQARRTSDQVADVLDLMRRHGSIEFAEEFGRGIARAAAASFEEAFGRLPDSSAKDFVRDLVPYMVRRDR